MNDPPFELHDTLGHGASKALIIIHSAITSCVLSPTCPHQPLWALEGQGVPYS